MKKIIYILLISLAFSCISVTNGTDGKPGENGKPGKNNQKGENGKSGENGSSEKQTIFKKQ
ncbi:hypothetical protein [uncultured Flavobacterium sp.]|uniref:hypothetical protein n=1 Tax=uncultured Flavobacterium sp. TaxID=165435 RepID=UPI0030ED7533|tara:strand:+ start:2049 stop:2231 length:183 start_codon:yes stop_codon:yes gene_type:complete